MEQKKKGKWFQSLHGGISIIISFEALGDLFMKGYLSEYGQNIDDIEFFEVLQILRQLTDFSFSVSKGGGKVGMREDISDIMLNQKKHYENILA